VRVLLASQVIEFVRNQAPQPRRRLRRALRDLAEEKGDVRALEGPLQEYHRLRTGPYRIILRYSRAKTIECIFAERRSIVYEVFSETMIERLSRGER